MVRRMVWLTVVSLLLFWSVIPASSVGAAASGKLEIFSWWTAGGEAEGLAGMFSVYKKLYPGVEIVNATVAGGAGTNAKAVLATRLTGGDPPDSFQVRSASGSPPHFPPWRGGEDHHPMPVAQTDSGALDGSSLLCSPSGSFGPSGSALVAIYRRRACLDRTPDSLSLPLSGSMVTRHRRLIAPGSLRSAWLTVP